MRTEQLSTRRTNASPSAPAPEPVGDSATHLCATALVAKRASSSARLASRAAMRSDGGFLLADVETTNDVEVSLRIDRFQVVQQPTPATHHHQQAPPTGVILLVSCRCSVRSPTRVVKMAICTSGEPVSLAAA